MISHPHPKIEYVIFNRELVPADQALVPVTAPGTRFGIGCFETMRLFGGKIRFLEDHHARLSAASAALGFPPPPAPDILRDLASQVALYNQIDDGVVRYSIHQRADLSVDTVITAAPPRPIFHRSSIHLLSSPFPHPGASPVSVHKHNNYALQLIAFNHASNSGADDAVLHDSTGQAVETAISNLYLRIGEQVFVPGPESGALPGIIRKQILEVAPTCGLTLTESPIRADLIVRADACWVSNSLIGIRPVHQWDDLIWPHAAEDPFLRKIRAAADLTVAYQPTAAPSSKQI